MSDNKNIPGPPPDDFTKTTPNIPSSARDDVAPDWDKTNYNAPRPAAPDEWNKTVTNIKPINTSKPDWGKTMYPGAQQNVPTPEWGMTEPNISVNAADFGSRPNDFAGSERVDKTTPYFQLPEAERQKYQNLPPTPTQKAEQEAKEKKGIPGWVWVSLGLGAMFLFMIAVLGVAGLILYMGDWNYEVTVKGAPVGSSVLVDDVYWATTDEDSLKLANLKAGRRKVSIVHPAYTCDVREVELSGRANPEPIIARCQQQAVRPTESCENFAPGEFDKAERCYNKALGDLPDPFTDEALVKALNILIINFDSGKYDVPPVRLAALQNGANYIKKLQQREPNTVLEIGGHTDSVGQPASNQTLSENRANAVKNVLMRFGVNGDGLQTRGYGATQPKFDNNTEQGKFLNRRIQYSIVKR
ncbi:MAG TPA: OmpA family protein [Pyrinomonadaceae bacterium]|nr:OmpA family protein [Pyrinomonadaceae bacterium]